jgi:hypothetical protein
MAYCGLSRSAWCQLLIFSRDGKGVSHYAFITGGICERSFGKFGYHGGVGTALGGAWPSFRHCFLFHCFLLFYYFLSSIFEKAKDHQRIVYGIFFVWCVMNLAYCPLLHIAIIPTKMGFDHPRSSDLNVFVIGLPEYPWS